MSKEPNTGEVVPPTEEVKMLTKEEIEFNEACDRYRAMVSGLTGDDRIRAINQFRCGL